MFQFSPHLNLRRDTARLLFFGAALQKRDNGAAFVSFVYMERHVIAWN
jgi:hypothetical protein